MTKPFYYFTCHPRPRTCSAHIDMYTRMCHVYVHGTLITGGLPDSCPGIVLIGVPGNFQVQLPGKPSSVLEQPAQPKLTRVRRYRSYKRAITPRGPCLFQCVVGGALPLALPSPSGLIYSPTTSATSKQRSFNLSFFITPHLVWGSPREIDFSTSRLQTFLYNSWSPFWWDCEVSRPVTEQNTERVDTKKVVYFGGYARALTAAWLNWRFITKN